jgi:hypothetical protein
VLIGANQGGYDEKSVTGPFVTMQARDLSSKRNPEPPTSFKSLHLAELPTLKP